MKKNLKIVYLDFDDRKNPLLGAGQAVATYEVARRLAKKGHKIEVFCSRYPGYKDRVEAGIKYTHIGLGSRHVRLNNAIFILLIPFVVRGLKADVILECFTSPQSTLLSPLFTRVPVIAIPTSFDAYHFSRLYKLPFHWFEKFGLRFYKYFIPAGKHHERRMRKHNPHIVTKTITHGFDEKYLTVKKKKAKHILFMGRYDVGQKGIDLLMEAFSKITRKTKLNLVMAGCGPDRKKIIRLISKHKLNKRVQMNGFASGKYKKDLFAHAKYFVVPSKQEGFCISALEALGFGVPVVCFNIQGLAWIDRKVSLKAEPFNVEEYSRLMLKAEDNRLNIEMSKSARMFAKNYSWIQVAGEYEKFIKFVVEDNVVRKSSKSILPSYQ
jgi:glycosyltransferase involved in cell wall biosynthesis